MDDLRGSLQARYDRLCEGGRRSGKPSPKPSSVAKLIRKADVKQSTIGAIAARKSSLLKECK